MNKLRLSPEHLSDPTHWSLAFHYGVGYIHLPRYPHWTSTLTTFCRTSWGPTTGIPECDRPWKEVPWQSST